MEMGERIKEIRLRKKVKQIDLAKIVGISNSYLSDIEACRATPSVKTLMKISKSLDVECAVLLEVDKI